MSLFRSMCVVIDVATGLRAAEIRRRYVRDIADKLPSDGSVAERSGTRLQSARARFDSGPSLQVDDDYDGAPWCSHCGAKRQRNCTCGPIPDND